MFLHASFLINCHLLREGFRASQIVSITNFVVVLSVGIMRVDCSSNRMGNSVDLEQRSRSVSYDLDLYSLLRSVCPNIQKLITV